MKNDITAMNHIVENIKTIARVNGIKLGELERGIGLSIGYFSRVKHGKGISLYTAYRASQILECSLDIICDPNTANRLRKQAIMKEIDALKAELENLKC